MRHLAGYLPVSLASGIAAFGGVYIFTRLLSAEDYGRYALMVSVMVLIHTLSLTPSEAAAYRFAGQADAEKRLPDHFRTALSLTWRSVVVAFVLLAGLGAVLGDLPAYLKILPWICLLLPLNTLIQMALEAHKATQNVGRYALVETTRLIASFAVGALIAWQSGLGAAAPFVGMVVVSAVLAISEGSWLFRRAKGGRTDQSERRRYLAYGLPIAAALVLDLVLSVADRFLIAVFLGEAAVGAYAAGYGVADKTVLLLCAWAAMAGSPLVMAAYDRGGAVAAQEAARGLIRTLLWMGIPAATGLALVARPLAEAMIGPEVRAGAMQIIPWIAFAGLLNGLLIHYVSESFQLTKKTGQRALLMVVPAVANVVLNLILIPQFALMGAVAATLISYALGLIVLASAGRRLVALPLPFSDLIRIALAALAMWPALMLVPAWGSWPELIAKALLGAGIYILASLILDAGSARQFLQDRRVASRGRTGA